MASLNVAGSINAISPPRPFLGERGASAKMWVKKTFSSPELTLMTKPDIAYDPYALPPDAILEPPKTLWEALKKIGPGIILAGTIV